MQKRSEIPLRGKVPSTGLPGQPSRAAQGATHEIQERHGNHECGHRRARRTSLCSRARISSRAASRLRCDLGAHGASRRARDGDDDGRSAVGTASGSTGGGVTASAAVQPCPIRPLAVGSGSTGSLIGRLGRFTTGGTLDADQLRPDLPPISPEVPATKPQARHALYARGDGGIHIAATSEALVQVLAADTGERGQLVTLGWGNSAHALDSSCRLGLFKRPARFLV